MGVPRLIPLALGAILCRCVDCQCRMLVCQLSVVVVLLSTVSAVLLSATAISSVFRQQTRAHGHEEETRMSERSIRRWWN